MYGVARPARWGLVAKNNPFRDYIPGDQDVFVMTFAKSGTNWVMQIAHQLIYHGKAEFDHLHDIVPWPDTSAMPGPLKKYAIPLDEAIHWRTSPERKRVIKTHQGFGVGRRHAIRQYVVEAVSLSRFRPGRLVG
jgi:hypothetical protein